MTQLPRPTDPPIPDLAAPATSRRWLAIRRWLDRAIALVAAVLSAPLVAVIALAIKRDDGGPPLIRVPRTGEGGRSFGMWKLRSMRAESPNGMASGATLTNGTSDDRITPIGRRLRAFHLDELPQLWNVVAGEMSLLGPRPETPEFVDLNDARWRSVLAFPPGMAGPTQLIVSDWEREVISASRDTSGYRNAVLPTKLAIDQWYLTVASPATDLLVSATLLRRFAPGTEAWTLRHRVFAEVPDAAPARAFLQARQLAERVARAGAAPRAGLTLRVARLLDTRVAQRSPAHVGQDLTRVGHDWIWQAKVPGGVVLYDAVHELAHLLSPEAAAVWLRCDGRSSVQVIATELAASNGVDPEQMLRDVATVILQLDAAGALVAPGARSALAPPEPRGRRVYASEPPAGIPRITDLPTTDQGPIFHALGYPFRVVSTPAFRDPIAKALAPLATDSSDHDDTAVARYEVVRSDDRTLVHLLLAGQHLRTGPADDAVDLLVWYVAQHATAASDQVVLHAAAVQRHDAVIVIPGPSGSGKSLLALALVAAGDGYVAEDKVALDLGSGHLHPFPQPFQLAPDAAPVLESIGIDLAAPVRTDATIVVDPDDVRAGSRSPGGPPSMVVAAVYRPGATLLVEPLDPAQTSVQLLSAAANLDVIGIRGFAALTELARQVPGYRVEYGDLAVAVTAIDELAARHAGTSNPPRR